MKFIVNKKKSYFYVWSMVDNVENVGFIIEKVGYLGSGGICF